MTLNHALCIAMTETISIIIPTLNEAANLPQTISRSRGALEIIVADGGSSDETLKIARQPGVAVVQSQRGRSQQMNAGAWAARGSILLFLHADTWLQEGSLQSLAAAMNDPRVAGGAFARRFRSDSPFLRFTCALALLRNRAIGWHLGDQAIFCRASIFRDLGGFAEMRAFEDVDFSRRLRRMGRTVTLQPAVLSSARRFERGAVKRTALDLLLTMRYLLHPAAFRV